MEKIVRFSVILFVCLVIKVSYAKTQTPEIPKGFELQVLEPVGGKIAKPKNWFYVERHQNSSSLGWVLSKEDLANEGSYETGMRIQFFIGVKDKTGKSPKEFVFSFLNKKKSEPKVKVLRTCTETDQGDFIHTCVEVEEPIKLGGNTKNYRIQYTLFWAKTMDIVVFTIGGTTTDKWEEHRKTFEAMSYFQLIDGDVIKKILDKEDG